MVAVEESFTQHRAKQQAAYVILPAAKSRLDDRTTVPTRFGKFTKC